MSSYLDESNTFMFSPDMGSASNIYYSTFHIDSDDSLMPFSSTKNSYDGLFVEPNLPRSYYKPYLNEYVKLYIRKAAVTY